MHVFRYERADTHFIRPLYREFLNISVSLSKIKCFVRKKVNMEINLLCNATERGAHIKLPICRSSPHILFLQKYVIEREQNQLHYRPTLISLGTKNLNTNRRYQTNVLLV